MLRATGVGAQVHDGLLRPNTRSREVDEVSISVTASATTFVVDGQVLARVHTHALGWRRRHDEWRLRVGDEAWLFRPHDVDSFATALEEALTTRITVDLRTASDEESESESR